MNDEMKRIVQDILAELTRAEHLHPIWPGRGHAGDHVRAVGKLVEEAGEAFKEANNLDEGTGSIRHIRRELIQAGAMAVRCLKNLKAVERQRINDADDGPASLNEVANEHIIYAETDSPVWLPSVLRVRIVGAGNKEWWYSDMIGRVFAVWKRGDNYEVMGGSSSLVRLIAVEDARVLGDNESQNLNDSEWWDTEPAYQLFVGRKEVEL